MRSFAALGIALSVAALTPAVAHAETPSRFHTTTVPISQPAGGGGPSSKIIFLNRCVGDCVVYPGNDDSRDNVSGIINGTRSVSEFSGSDAEWDEVVECVKRRYSPFDIEVTDVDPGPNTQHFEAIVAGDPGDIDQPCGQNGCVLGVAPYDRFGCEVINNAITYTFANTIFDYLSSPINNICDTVAQETAHAFTLDHELLDSDPMTYLDYSGERAFQNMAAQCGEYQNDPRQCYCTGPGGSNSTQNSYQFLYSLFGEAAPSPPEVTITEPGDGDVVEGGFVVRAAVNDPQGIERVELLIDGAEASEITSAPWVLNAPVDIGNGNHVVIVRAFDGAGTAGTDEITVTVGAPCGEDDCEGNRVCVDGRCVIGPGEDGGLGEPCTAHEECASGLCGRAGDERYCTETCALEDGFCPDGFACLNAGDTGVCWPSEGGGGCVASSSSRDGRGGVSNGLPIAFGTLLALFLIRRRR